MYQNAAHNRGAILFALMEESRRFSTRAIPSASPRPTRRRIGSCRLGSGRVSSLRSDPDVVPQRLGRGITRCYIRSSSSDSGQTFDSTRAWGGPATVGSFHARSDRSLGSADARGTHVGRLHDHDTPSVIGITAANSAHVHCVPWKFERAPSAMFGETLAGLLRESDAPP
ncbi:hypothetical protein ALC62_07567 [Cyphomyrmex costatus]|uniref:Uncharacterized protein n=1 Tax=Cyphomyrmex costatus TaxID=456900 RepID=A0A195CLL7_9HYME|nr:hypothetical protein ALC62_07567 [Cyphomyrmex costatus]